jgi:hypothetical protein
VNEKEFLGMTPLAYMASAFKSPYDEKFATIATMLIAHGATVDAVDQYHKTPLLHAVESENSHLAEVLLKNGANQNDSYDRANFGMSLLHMAIRDRDEEMVRVLLKYNPPLDARDGDGATPLLLAEELNQTNMVAMLHQAQPQAPLKTYAVFPTKEAMRAIAQRIANGDETALDELKKTADNMYGDVHDYQKEHARVMMNLFRMKAAFDLLGEEAGKGNEAAFQALKKSLQIRRLSSFAPDALGIAAAAGNKDALDILLHYEQWDILEPTAVSALYVPAMKNVRPAVDFYAGWLVDFNPSERGGGMLLDVTNALASAAAKGNKDAQEAIDKFFAELPTPNY